MNRQAVYRGLLSAIGRYFFHYAHDEEYDEWVEFHDDEPYKTILDWIEDGRGARVKAFHVWGVGGGRGSQFSYDYCKDREIEWVDVEWVVRESDKYVLTGATEAPRFVAKTAENFTEARRIEP